MYNDEGEKAFSEALINRFSPCVIVANFQTL